MSLSSKKSASWRQQRRLIIDQFARYGIGLGGVSVIFAIVLIFFYLLWVVIPMFTSASIEPVAQYDIPAVDAGATLYLAPEESGQLGMRISDNADVIFFNLNSGEVVTQESLELPFDAAITKVQTIAQHQNLLALTLEHSKIFFVRIKYAVNFVNDERQLIPSIEYPFESSVIDTNDQKIIASTVTRDEEKLTVAMLLEGDTVVLQRYEIESGDEIAEPESSVEIEVSDNSHYILMGTQALWLYVANDSGLVDVYSIADPEEPELVASSKLLTPEKQLNNLKMLLGGVSILAADDKGGLAQWSLQRDAKNNYTLARIRGFENKTPIVHILPEHRRKGLLAIDAEGGVSIYHTTADRLLGHVQLYDQPLVHYTLAQRANGLLVEDLQGQVHFAKIENPHPELSWDALWGEIVYEGYNKPGYTWQSSSADNDFEPKFSLIPLSFGTLKAAFYAMLFATPLAIMGAIYTAYFMSPKMRSWVKPGIEIMEALPTVILGFIAGLWLAPVVEDSLSGILSLFFVIPLGMLLFAWGWQHLPKIIRHLIPDGWQAAILMPVVIFLVWFSMVMGPGIESLFFDGNLRTWLENTYGIGYDQRNALVVGLAMGLAVIPTIFSITEDAIFSVPRHLTNGSLALGATPWQTLVRVVMLTASPGIFSAVMIGLGRAVGETMIVLMATGNTPVMDFSIFEGMRTLSANIAVELPESEIDSTHYRILFLAALVLFAVTFLFNTAAEVVRQRLRKRYGSL